MSHWMAKRCVLAIIVAECKAMVYLYLSRARQQVEGNLGCYLIPCEDTWGQLECLLSSFMRCADLRGVFVLSWLRKR